MAKLRNVYERLRRWIARGAGQRLVPALELGARGTPTEETEPTWRDERA